MLLAVLMRLYGTLKENGPVCLSISFWEGRRDLLYLVILMQVAVRTACGEEVELLHDIHERVQPMDAINLIRRLEEYNPFFIEDPFSPENMEWFKQLRTRTSVPIALGELFNNINEFKMPMVNQWFDYIRVHVSQIGGITPAMKIARLGEWFNVKTAWHGPGDTSPVGHAANGHIDLAVWHFGIQEGGYNFSEKEQTVFPGCPTF